MSRVRTFFVEEAGECLTDLRAELKREAPDPVALHRAARQLRGSAQLARFGAVAGEAGALEADLKESVATGWKPGHAAAVEAALEVLEAKVAAVRDGRVEPDEREPMSDEHVQDAGSTATDPMPLEELEYQGEAALARALDLREPLEKAIAGGEPSNTLVDELFDLIRLGTK